MPHLAEECWSALGHSDMLVHKEWPQADERLIVAESRTVVVQINGKKRGEFQEAPGNYTQEYYERRALEVLDRLLEGKAPRKMVVVPGRIVNVVL